MSIAKYKKKIAYLKSEIAKLTKELYHIQKECKHKMSNRWWYIYSYFTNNNQATGREGHCEYCDKIISEHCDGEEYGEAPIYVNISPR